ncbi:MAG TPA: hypothetical protein PKD80_12205 [Microthrixaceae bacterium]|jgi:hypothetical protein|nr:hypothetical protein [uncultured Candidatus Microthrix sp.]HMS13856.1 hypothetical protein [Microthrixaceae bacterium]HMT23042.1 hypothetical protein [Microthrixaceae bacterium]HMT59720.1 hypothetical protein [Microthrixaceae bacterium]
MPSTTTPAAIPASPPAAIPASPPAPRAPAPYPTTGQLFDRHPVTDWLVRRRNDGATPDEICAELVGNGWDADSASTAALASLRTTDRHRLLYIGECWGAGLAALGAGSAAHVALRDQSNPLDLAMFLTVMLVAAPIGVAAGALARRVEAEEPHAIWSPTRRTLFATLAGCTATVGIVRMLTYTFAVVAAAVGADGYEFTPSSIVQVMVTLGLATPLFWWSLVEWRRSNVALRSLGKVAASQTGSTGSVSSAR